MAAQRNGGTIVLMDQFDPREALRLIERYHVTHGLWATEMFATMLALPEPIRLSYIMTDLQRVTHIGPPCPPEILQAMLEWWGPVLHEYRED
jgi:long-chain acyl-CoA synthetase